MVDFEITRGQYECMEKPCGLKINDKYVDLYDFGRIEEEENDCDCGYCCPGFYFVGYPVNEKVLYKYGITEEDYRAIIAACYDKMSFSGCGQCE